MSWKINTPGFWASTVMVSFIIALVIGISWGIHDTHKRQADPLFPQMENEEQRFVVEYRQRDNFASGEAIIRDRTTGRQYLFVKVGAGAGLALMPESRMLRLVPD